MFHCRYPGIAKTPIIAGCGLLAGCALFRAPPPATTFVKSSERAVHFTVGFDDARMESIAYRNPSEYEEYDGLTGMVQAEVVFSVANGPQTALDFPQYELQSLTKSWSFNRKEARMTHWGPTDLLRTQGRAFRYALYVRRDSDGGRHCMAFLRAWDNPPDDPMQRPGKALFGYYCAATGQPLDNDRAAAVLRGLRVSEREIPPVYFGQDLRRDAAALKAARGQRDATAGNPGFPFRFSRYYNVGDASDTFQ